MSSPDADVARTLLLILEDEWTVVRETTLQGLETRLKAGGHDALLVDLPAFADDVGRQLRLLRDHRSDAPIVLLRTYRPLNSELSALLVEVADAVFFKPVDVEQVSGTIKQLVQPR